MKSIIRQQFLKNKESWIKSFQSGLPQDQNGNFLPWYSYPAIDYLKRFIKPSDMIFEFGSGCSTIFYASQAKHVTSIETNPRWYKISQGLLEAKQLTDYQITLMENGIINNEYQIFPGNFKNKFDVIVIDSIKRYQCALNCLGYLKESGAIILDDSQRENYKKIFQYFEKKGYKSKIFEGIEPGKLKIKKTTIFFKN